jgi:hypothetical protein
VKGEHMERNGCKITYSKWKHLRNNKKKYFCKNCFILASRSDQTQNMQIDIFSPLCTKCMHSVHKHTLKFQIITLTTKSFRMLSTMYSKEMRAAKISSVKRVNSFTKTLPSKQTTTRPIIPSQRPIYTRTVRKLSPFVKQNWKKKKKSAQLNFNLNIYICIKFILASSCRKICSAISETIVYVLSMSYQEHYNQMPGFPHAIVFPDDDQYKLVGDPLCSFQNGIN